MYKRLIRTAGGFLVVLFGFSFFLFYVLIIERRWKEDDR